MRGCEPAKTTRALAFLTTKQWHVFARNWPTRLVRVVVRDGSLGEGGRHTGGHVPNHKGDLDVLIVGTGNEEGRIGFVAVT